MSIYRIVAPGKFIGASTDIKPTRANESQVVPGATYLEYDTGNMFITYDGTNWVIKDDNAPTRTKLITGSNTGKGLGAYSANEVICNSTASGTTIAFSSVARENEGYGCIDKALIQLGTSNVTPRLTMLLFNAVPVGGTMMDNAGNLHPAGTDTAKFVGQIDWLALENLGSGLAHQVATPSTYGNAPLIFNCASGADDLFGVLVTKDAVTIGTDCTIRVDLIVTQY